jgi:predicted DNA-binding transcriptional regulator AlpA
VNAFLKETAMNQKIYIHPKFSKIDPVSSQVGMGKSTILAWEAAGKFPRAVRLSATIRVWLQEDIDKWIVEQHAKAMAPTELHDSAVCIPDVTQGRRT